MPLMRQLSCIVLTVIAYECGHAAALDSGRVHAKDGLTYVWIAPGEVTIGCAQGDDICRDDEKPRRTVVVSSGFWLSATEVTVGAFRRFVADTEYRTTAQKKGFGGFLTKSAWENREGVTWNSPGFDQDESHPVVLVSWDDAKAFCAWSGGRLPTEEEWELAARGGIDGARYVWGDGESPMVEGVMHANVADRSAAGVSLPPFESDYDDGAAFTSPVGQFAPNRLQLYDMAGNVLEWCADSDDSNRRMARGGAWNNPPQLVRISRRSRFAAEAALTILGFRCARGEARRD